jgi:hypothetical protein
MCWACSNLRMDDRAESHCSTMVREITKNTKKHKIFFFFKNSNFFEKKCPNPTAFLGRQVSLR